MNENSKKAWEIWGDFCKKLLYENRFFCKHEVTDILAKVVSENPLLIDIGCKLYCARIYEDIKDESANLKETLDKYVLSSLEFYGYEPENSGPPTNFDIIAEGRSNPPYMRYLYTAEQPYTAVAEIRPSMESVISVATFETLSSLRIANLSNDFYYKIEGNNKSL